MRMRLEPGDAVTEDDIPRMDPGAQAFDLGTHGRQAPVPLDALLSDDADLWLATADMRAWSDAHPCACEALCECD